MRWLRWVRLMACVVPLGFYPSGAAWAQDRVALVIGISKYSPLRPLDNAARDAREFAALLRENDFKVIESIDGSFADVSDALVDFDGKAKLAKEGVVFFSGHGFESGNGNVLAASDASLDCSVETAKRSLVLASLFRHFARLERVVVILDACRDNPFPFCPPTKAGGRSGIGFGNILVDSTPGLRARRVLVASSTTQGELASDGKSGEGSPYLRALIDRLKQNPTQRFSEVLNLVSQDVEAGSKYGQRPSSLTIGPDPEICLRANCAKSVATPATPPSESSASPKKPVSSAPANGQIEAKRKEPERPNPPVIKAKAKEESTDTGTAKRPDPTSYSRQIWASGVLQSGERVSQTTRFGKLTCIGGNNIGSNAGSRNRDCWWN